MWGFDSFCLWFFNLNVGLIKNTPKNLNFFKKKRYKTLNLLVHTINTKYSKAFYSYEQNEDVLGWFAFTNFHTSVYTPFTIDIPINFLRALKSNCMVLLSRAPNSTLHILLKFFSISKSVFISTHPTYQITTHLYNTPPLNTRLVVFIQSTQKLYTRKFTCVRYTTLPKKTQVFRKSPSSLFNQMKLKWDFLASSTRLDWTHRNYEEQIIRLYAYTFKNNQLRPWTSHRILNNTTKWVYARASLTSLNNYLFTINTTKNTLFIASDSTSVENSFEEMRQKTLLWKKKLRPFRPISRRTSMEFSSFFVNPTRNRKKHELLSSKNCLTSLFRLTSLDLKFLTIVPLTTFNNIIMLFLDFQAFKWVLFSYSTKISLRCLLNSQLFLLAEELDKTYFYARSTLGYNNLIATPLFSHKVEKHFLKIINKIKYTNTTTPWQITPYAPFFHFLHR